MKANIAVGFGNNIDYEIVLNSKAIEDLINRYDIRLAELDINTLIKSERDLVISILSFLQLSIGGERIVASSDIIEQFSAHFEKKITLGGTSVRAAIAMRKFGYKSALHLVTLNDHVRKLIPHDSPYVCSSTEESLYPHLIAQYGQGIHIKANDIDICASHANRLIYHNDTDNITMNLNEAYGDLITEAKVLLFSGFNAMESETLLAERMETILRIMSHLPEDALVYYEDAGFHEPRFSHLIYRTLAGKLDIVSLNEDELQDYLDRRIDLLDAVQIKEAVEDLHKLIPVPVLVVHSKYWALAYGDNAARFAKSLKGGTTMATTRFRHGDDFTVDDYHTIETLPPTPAGAHFTEAITQLMGNKISCVPVAQVEQANATTVGLGDAFVGGFLPALLSVEE
ncbi:MAG: hypothetical protein KDJ65_36280 [Anaerolineae bacterium]|nr:hypothetical protein [Anaerolineae bacterium]